MTSALVNRRREEAERARASSPCSLCSSASVEVFSCFDNDLPSALHTSSRKISTLLLHLTAQSNYNEGAAIHLRAQGRKAGSCYFNPAAFREGAFRTCLKQRETYSHGTRASRARLLKSLRTASTGKRSA